MTKLGSSIIFLLFLLASGVHADAFYYRGIMGDGLAVQMYLNIEDELATGSYYYDGVGIPLRLTGSFSGGLLSLDEYSEEQGESLLTGKLLGRFSESATDFFETISGEWVNPYANLFSFSLVKIAEFVTIDIEQSRIKASSSYPFFIQDSLEPVNRLLQETFIERQIDFLREGQDMLRAGELLNGWFLDSSVTISYSADDLLSLEESIYAYTGGAHGTIGLVSHNLLLEASGLRILELRDMFARQTDFMAVLSPHILAELRQQEAAWVLDGTVTALHESDLRTFSISPRGLSFTFEPYLMGPYAQGSFEVLVGYDVLVSLIDPSSPIYRFMAKD